MTKSIVTGPVDHLRLTVTDVDRSREFYMNVLGFQSCHGNCHLVF